MMLPLSGKTGNLSITIIPTQLKISREVTWTHQTIIPLRLLPVSHYSQKDSFPSPGTVKRI